MSKNNRHCHSKTCPLIKDEDGIWLKTLGAEVPSLTVDERELGLKQLQEYQNWMPIELNSKHSNKDGIIVTFKFELVGDGFFWMSSIKGADLAAKLMTYELTFGPVDFEQILRVDRLQYQPLLSKTFGGVHNNTKPSPYSAMPLMKTVMKALQCLFKTVANKDMELPSSYIPGYLMRRHYIPKVSEVVINFVTFEAQPLE